jgi:uncharacterized protein (DUF1499 family)
MGLFSGSRPGNLGAVDGMLARCKTSPNCVSSQTDQHQDPSHYVEPLQAGSDPHLTWAALKRLLADMPRVNVVSDRDGYLYAEFSTPLMGFVDDVEFLQAGEFIHVRSASRLGRSDFGVNRARIEAIRTQLAAMASK